MMPILCSRRRFAKNLFVGSSLLGAALPSQGTLVVSVNQIESDDPVDMSTVVGFERVGDFDSPLSHPDAFWREVRPILRKAKNLDLQIKKAEISAEKKVLHAYRLQAKRIQPNTHTRFLISHDWEVWVQFLIRQVDEAGTGLKLIDVMMAVGERPDANTALRSLKNYEPARTMGKQLLDALEAGMAKA